MIRRAISSDSEGIYSLMRRVYLSHSFLRRNMSNFKELLDNNSYISFVYEENKRILGHVGLLIGNKFALMNALVVDPALRRKKIGKRLFETIEKFSETNGNLDFLIGYSMMQHPWSQKLYSDSFKPIGLALYYNQIFSKNDSTFNVGKSNGEIILCKKLKEEIKRYDILCPSNQIEFTSHILNSLNINYCLRVYQEETNVDSSFFVGYHPDVKNGIFLPTWSNKNKINFNELQTTNKERMIFKKKIENLFLQSQEISI